MLDGLRKNTKLVIWCVIIAFALWGGYSVSAQFQKEGRVAGEIFKKEVTFQEFNQFYHAGQIFSYGNKPINDSELLKQYAWQNLILSHEAKRRKIKVSDDEVRQEIQRVLAAQKMENMSAAEYQRWVENGLHEPPHQFEKQIREILRIQKLVQQINDAEVVDPPNEEEAKQKFIFEESKISLEAREFATREEAKAFREKVPGEEQWREDAKAHPDALKPTGLIPLLDLVRTWKVHEEDARKLQETEKGAVSEPIALAEKYAVFLTLEKQNADPAKFDKDLKQKYLDGLTQIKKYQRFLQWTFELQQKAGLKDYLPSPEPPEPPEPVV